MSKFTELINSDSPTVVDFFAEWCGPCKTMAPILQDVVSKINGKAKVIKIDIDKNPSVAAKYKVQSVPTLIIFQKGEIKWRQAGVIPAKQLIELISKMS
jgi:thioredoxin 1